jgi:hypothetical protein
MAVKSAAHPPCESCKSSSPEPHGASHHDNAQNNEEPANHYLWWPLFVFWQANLNKTASAAEARSFRPSSSL